MKTGDMLPTDAQQTIEYHWSKQHLDGYIRKVLTNSNDVQQAILYAVNLMREWVNAEHYESKQLRLGELKVLEFEPLLMDIMVGVAHLTKPELLAGVVGKLAHRVKMSDNRSAALTMAEILALLCQTGMVLISKNGTQGSLMVESCITLPDALVTAIERAHFLPPMVCTPNEVTDNFTSPYLTYNESQILGKRNGHSDDICLDVINIQNNVSLSLNEAFLKALRETPKNPVDTPEKAQLWNQFIVESNEMYNLMLNHGNEFHLTNKVDKRGRLYAQGYHITTQGSPYKKAMLELTHKETVTGVP